MRRIEEKLEIAKADGTIDRLDRLTSAANLLLEISSNLFVKAGEELERRDMLRYRDLGKYRKNAFDSRYVQNRKYRFFHGLIGSKDWSGEIDAYTEKIVKLLNIEEDYNKCADTE